MGRGLGGPRDEGYGSDEELGVLGGSHDTSKKGDDAGPPSLRVEFNFSNQVCEGQMDAPPGQDFGGRTARDQLTTGDGYPKNPGHRVRDRLTTGDD